MFEYKKLIIFDLDGTLIDSVPDLANSINLMLEELDRPTFTTEKIRGWVGNGAQMLVKRAYSGKDEVSEEFDSDELKNALNIFFSKYNENVSKDTVLYKHVDTTLRELHQKDYKFALVTNKPEKFVLPILNHFGIANYFELIIGGDTLEEKKPKPTPLFHVCNKINVTVDEAVMIGDSKNDILAAHAANIDSIGVTYGYNYGENIETFRPSIVIDEFNQLLNYF